MLEPQVISYQQYSEKFIDYCEHIGMPQYVEGHNEVDIALALSHQSAVSYRLGISYRLAAIISWSMLLDVIQSQKMVKH